MFGMRKMLRQNSPGKGLILLIACFTLVFTTIMPVTAQAAKTQTAVKHSPPDYFVPKFRIQIDATVSDPSGINLVRCYFKSTGQADFVFVPMTQTGGSGNGAFYSATLPAPSQATEQIEYLFLTVNNNNQIVKTQTFTINRKEKKDVPAWQHAPGGNEIQVSMELDQVPQELTGFTDNIVMNKVESGLRFGVVAGGLYYLTRDKAAHTSGTAASSTSAGTITAASAGYSTAFLVGAGIAGAAVVGGSAAALSGGGGGGSSSHDDGEITVKTLVGTWHVTESGQPSWYMDASLNDNGRLTFTEYVGYSSSGTGSWTFNGSTDYFTFSVDNGGGMSGYISGSTDNFYVDGHYSSGTPGYFHWVRK